MRKRIKTMLSAFLAASMLAGVLAVSAVPASAVDADIEAPLTVKATSNYFPCSENKYYGLSEFEDENGNAFVTVEYKLLADQKYLINTDIGELTYDPDVLEWNEEYNMYGEGRARRVDFFPFAFERNYGAGVIHKTAEGRIVANFSSIQPAALAYNEEDGSAVTVVKAVFKVLDREAGETTVNCSVKYLAMCDESEPTPHVQHQVIYNGVENSNLNLGETLSTVISPESQEASDIIGNVTCSGGVTVEDATELQRYFADMNDLDLTSKEMFIRADANRDGIITIRDVTQIQRYVSEIIETL